MERTESVSSLINGAVLVGDGDQDSSGVASTKPQHIVETRRPLRTAFIQEIVPSYRQPFFEGLGRADGVELTVFAGEADVAEGFLGASENDTSFAWQKLERRLTKLRGSRLVRLRGLLMCLVRLRPDVVISVGNKGFVQNHLLLLLKRVAGFRMYLLQHAFEYRAASRRFRTLEWLYFRRYLLPLVDGVILYTEYERERLIQRGVNPKKLWFTNNTLDIEGIAKIRQGLQPAEAEDIRSRLGVRSAPSIVFLGRLVRGKQVELLLEYFDRIRARVPNAQLIVVGDGPLRRELTERWTDSPSVVLTGGIYDELVIASLMQVARAVFLPGYSGLTVNHAFAYGVPFVTLRSPAHKPEIDYVCHGVNGYLLEPDDVATNVSVLSALLTDDVLFAQMSRAAHATASRLTMKAMVDNVASVITGCVP